QLKYFFLAIREQIVRILQPALLQLAHVILEKRVGDGWTEERLAMRDGLHGLIEVLVRIFLEQVSLRSGSKSPRQVSLIGVHTQDDYRDLRVLLDKLRSGLYAVQIRHSDIHDHDIGQQFFRQAYGFTAFRGLTDYFECLVLFQLQA